MLHRYLPMTEQDQQQMLAAIGVSSVDDLFSDIPQRVRFQGEYNIKKAASEPQLLKELNSMAAKNAHLKDYASFLGAGVYDHYMPVIVDHVISRSEFYTAYTPYQPEISQGELQAIFEFQTMICELTGMDVANSSMYDGGTALAEAAMLSAGQTKKKKVLVSAAVHPESKDVLKTYAKGQYIEVVEIPAADGVTDMIALEKEMGSDVAAVIVQYPNFYGEFGADIVIGDAQPFGIPSQFGGPHCGYFATTSKLMRKIPGRLVGQTVDENGKRGFVLTLQAREQHIRRDKATSNICSNQALNALAASVAMTALGKQGVKEMALQNLSKTHYAYEALKAKGINVAFEGPFFNELVVKLPVSVTEANNHLLASKIIGGYDLSRD